MKNQSLYDDQADEEDMAYAVSCYKVMSQSPLDGDSDLRGDLGQERSSSPQSPSALRR